MFQQLQLARDYSAGIAFHGEVERRIVVFDCVDVVAYLYLCGQFFPDLPFNGILWSLTWFHLATRELPAILELAVAPLGGKEFVVLDNDGCYYMDGLHAKSILGKS